MKLPKSFNKKQKVYIAGVAIVVIVIISLGYAYQNGAFLCRLNGATYTGQAADNEQALNKLAVYAGGLERNNSPPISLMQFNESRVQSMEIKAWLDNQQTTIRGFVFDAPYRNGDRLNYGDGYLLSDAGYLYKLSSPRC